MVGLIFSPLSTMLHTTRLKLRLFSLSVKTVQSSVNVGTVSVSVIEGDLVTPVSLSVFHTVVYQITVDTRHVGKRENPG